MLPQRGASQPVLPSERSGPGRGAFRLAGSPVQAATWLPPLVTTEGVVVELNPAGLCSRTAAAIIDLGVLYTVLTAVATLFGLLIGITGGSTVAALAGLVLGGGAVLAYPITLEALWNGRTVGKAALGLRVVGVDGAPIGFRAAAIRAALLLVDVLVVPFGALWCVALLLSARHRRLGDVAAGTMVVRTRRGDVGVLRPIQFTPPPPLEPFRHQLDVAGLDDEAYRLIRDVLVRQRELTDAARQGLTERTAAAVAGRLGHPILPWMTAEQYLTCIEGAYQLRHRQLLPRATAAGRVGR